MSTLTTPVLSTKEVSSGIAKIQKIADGAVKAFPKLTHHQIAEKLVEIYGDTIQQKRAEIKAALEEVAAGKRNKTGIAAKQKGLAKLETYELIVETVANCFEEHGRSQVVEMPKAA